MVPTANADDANLLYEIEAKMNLLNNMINRN